MFVSPYNEGIILVFAREEGQIWIRPQVHRAERRNPTQIKSKETHKM